MIAGRFLLFGSWKNWNYILKGNLREMEGEEKEIMMDKEIREESEKVASIRNEEGEIKNKHINIKQYKYNQHNKNNNKNKHVNIKQYKYNQHNKNKNKNEKEEK